MYIRGRVGIVGVGLLVAWTGLAGPAVGQETAVSAGARVYGEVCGRCHTARSPLERSDHEWIIIANHMRVRGNLTGQQLRSVLAFLQATNEIPVMTGVMEDSPILNEPPSQDPAVVALGRDLVSQKACIGCHVVAGAGGQVGPNLAGVVGRRGPASVRRKMADPTFDNATSMMPNFGLSPDEIEALLAYIATLEREFEESGK